MRDHGVVLKDLGAAIQEQGNCLRDQGVVIKDLGVAIQEQGASLKVQGACLLEQGASIKAQGADNAKTSDVLQALLRSFLEKQQRE
jgi:hypothetical protein